MDKSDLKIKLKQEEIWKLEEDEQYLFRPIDRDLRLKYNVKSDRSSSSSSEDSSEGSEDDDNNSDEDEREK